MIRRAVRTNESDVESVKGLVKKLSLKWWYRLPSVDRAWVDPDDFMQESFWYICNKLKKRFDSSRGMKWSTYVYFCLDQHLGSVSLQMSKRRIPVEALHIVDSVPTHVPMLEEAKQVYKTIYSYASDELKAVFAAHFGVPSGFAIPRRQPQRMRYEGKRWSRLYYEIWRIVEEFHLSFRPIHLEVLMQYGNLQLAKN